MVIVYFLAAELSCRRGGYSCRAFTKFSSVVDRADNDAVILFFDFDGDCW